MVSRRRTNGRRPAQRGRSVPTSIVLLSGGLDSTACMHFARERGDDVLAVFVDYGQQAQVRERRSARKIAKHYGAEIMVVGCRGIPVQVGEIVGRNAFLAFVGLMAVPRKKGKLVLGIHTGTSYYDCTSSFAGSLDRFIQDYTNGRMCLSTPFLEWSKREIFAYATEKNVPVNFTWSCETSSTRACDICNSCRDRRALNASAAEHI